MYCTFLSTCFKLFLSLWKLDYERCVVQTGHVTFSVDFNRRSTRCASDQLLIVHQNSTLQFCPVQLPCVVLQAAD